MERIYVRLLPMTGETKKRLCKYFAIGHGINLNGCAWAQVAADQKEKFDWCITHGLIALIPEPPRKAPIKPLSLAEQLKLIKVSPRGKKTRSERTETKMI